MRSYIDKFSWRCLLGKMAKNVRENDLYATWNVNKTRHVVMFQPIKDLDIFKDLVPCSFHYLSLEDVKFLKSKYKITSRREPTVGLVLEETLNPTGKSHRGLRNKINRFKRLEIEVLDNYKEIDDVKKFIRHWGDEYSLKYFRNNSSKNLHFYSNEFHNDCINSFCYHNNELVACGTLSPIINQHSSYIIGKALYKEIPILSEFIDFSLYGKAYEMGCKFVLMGLSSSNGLLQYKQKFPGLVNYFEYFGKVLNEI